MTCSCITALKKNYLIGCEGKQFLRLDQIYLLFSAIKPHLAPLSYTPSD